MPRPRDLTDVRVLAHHEAGHALAACLVHMPISSVTIVPDGDSLGRVHCSLYGYRDFHPDAHVSHRTTAQAKKVILVALAGAVAEARAVGRKRMPSNRDDYHVDQAVTITSQLCGSFDEVVAYVDFMWVQTTNIVNLYWKQIRILASALVEEKTIGQRRVRELLKARDLIHIELL